MSYLTANNKLLNTNNKIIYCEQFPPNGEEVLFYTKFDLESSIYFKDLSSSHLDASALTTTTPYDSIALNTDIRLQNVCSSAGCFNQFYNGIIPDVSNSAKVVLLSDLSQLYLDNYIFSDVSNNLFFIYSTEQINDNLNLILNKIGSRIKKITCWGTTSTGAGTILSTLIGTDLFAFPLDCSDGLLNYNIIDKSVNKLVSFTNIASNNFVPYLDFTIASNGHIIGFPYNETRICDINPLTKDVSFYGNFNNEFPSVLGQGRFNNQTDLGSIILTNGTLLNIPRTPSVTYNHGITIYNPSTNVIDVFGANVFTYYSGGNCCGLKYINDNLIVAIPKYETKVVNIDPIAKTTTTYGTLPSGLKYFANIKINNDLIVCVPHSGTQLLNIHPISQTVESYGSFTGAGLYNSAVLLDNGHVFAIPGIGASQFLDIDPSAKTYELWGSATGYYDRSYITLNTGELILFPWTVTSPIMKVNPYTRTTKDIFILPNSTNRPYGHFGYRTPFPYQVKSNQIIVTPYNYPSIIDLDPITEKVNKIGWFNNIVYSGAYNMIEETSQVNIYNNRILICKYTSFGIIDIELR